MRISDWSSDVCSSDLSPPPRTVPGHPAVVVLLRPVAVDIAGPHGVEGALQRRAPSAVPMAVAFTAAAENEPLPVRAAPVALGEIGRASRWDSVCKYV